MGQTKTALDLWIAIGPPLIAGGVAILVAFLVTWRLDMQKQRMELYKIFYAERIAASKKIMALAGTAQQRCVRWFGSTDEELKKEIGDLITDLFMCVNENEWVFDPPVFEAAEAFRLEVIGILGRDKEANLAMLRNKREALSSAIGTMLKKEHFQNLLAMK